MNNRVRTIKLLLWAVCGIALAVAIMRLVFGLGAASNLSDAYPWGLWKGFGVVAFIALAAGGFVLTGIIHVFHLERYHAVLRPAVLTSFLGYSSAAAILTFDIGISWRIWHPIFFWQVDSPLFEVAWCVMLYLTVLLLEFSPIVMEYFPGLAGIVRFLKKFSLPLVILGVMISCLHQSTLGTIFLITPLQLHPLWYSSLLPVLFIISAAGLGITVVAAELLIIPYLYGRKPNLAVVSGLARVAAVVLGVYFLLRVGELFVRGVLPGVLLEGSWESVTFMIEMIVGILLPAVLLSFRGIRDKPSGLIGCALLIIPAVVFHRIAVSGLAMMGAVGGGYFPAWSEFILMGGIMAAAGLAYFFAVEKLDILDQKSIDKEIPAEKTRPSFGPGAAVWLGEPVVAAVKKYSLAFVVAFSVGFMFFPFDTSARDGTVPVPAEKARGGDKLRIDGNNDGFFVMFDHLKHVNKMGDKESCKVCHHFNYPNDQETDCARCHSDMYVATSIFDHDSHVARQGGNRACNQCHPADRNRGDENTKDCMECHKDGLGLVVSGSPIKVETKGKWYHAASYTDAMHRLCVTCHKEIAGRLGDNEHGTCKTCHKPESSKDREAEWASRQTVLSRKWVITTRPLLLPPDVKLDKYVIEKP